MQLQVVGYFHNNFATPMPVDKSYPDLLLLYLTEFLTG